MPNQIHPKQNFTTTGLSVLRVWPMDHRQRVQNQEALNRVTDGLRDPCLSLYHDHQDLQLIRPSPHLALLRIVGHPAQHDGMVQLCSYVGRLRAKIGPLANHARQQHAKLALRDHHYPPPFVNSLHMVPQDNRPRSMVLFRISRRSARLPAWHRNWHAPTRESSAPRHVSVSEICVLVSETDTTAMNSFSASYALYRLITSRLNKIRISRDEIARALPELSVRWVYINTMIRLHSLLCFICLILFTFFFVGYSTEINVFSC